MQLLIRGGRVIDPASGTDTRADVLVEDGRIAAIGPALTCPGAQQLPARGLVVAPGLVDMHVHLRQPGFEYKVTVATGFAAAARGGVTAVAAMANTKPPADSPEVIEQVRALAAGTGAEVLPVGAVTVGLRGEDLTDFAALKAAGAAALSDDGVPIQSEALLRRALLGAKAVGLPLLDHCEDLDLVKNYAVNAGAVADKLGIPGRPARAEVMQVERDVRLSLETGAHVHICHVSAAGSVEAVRQGKARGARVTCETCPQYFTLTEDAVLEKGSLARVNPPLRTPKDVAAIREGLMDGTIDAIVTDHAPHSAEEKALPLTQAPSGMVGLETSLALSLTGLYHAGFLTLSQVIEKMSAAPAAVLGLGETMGALAIGRRADLVLFDPDETWTIDPAQFASKGRNTPFGGCVVRGRVKYTISKGKIIYRQEG